jgi:hypothetical protein
MEKRRIAYKISVKLEGQFILDVLGVDSGKVVI